MPAPRKRRVGARYTRMADLGLPEQSHPGSPTGQTTGRAAPDRERRLPPDAPRVAGLKPVGEPSAAVPCLAARWRDAGGAGVLHGAVHRVPGVDPKPLRPVTHK